MFELLRRHASFISMLTQAGEVFPFVCLCQCRSVGPLVCLSVLFLSSSLCLPCPKTLCHTVCVCVA
jgi:hypothetical protein